MPSARERTLPSLGWSGETKPNPAGVWGFETNPDRFWVRAQQVGGWPNEPPGAVFAVDPATGQHRSAVVPSRKTHKDNG